MINITLVRAIDFAKIKNIRLFMLVFIIVSLLYSKILLSIELPSSSFPDSIWNDLDKFPMQWYFMNFGWYMNYQMYLIHATAAVIFLVLFYYITRDAKLIKYLYCIRRQIKISE